MTEKTVWNGRTYHRWGTYFARSVGRSKRLLHRDVWEHHNGPIPAGYEIHHVDHDAGNNAIGNLQCVTVAEHDRSWTDGHRQKLAARRSGRVASETPEQARERRRACGLES